MKYKYFFLILFCLQSVIVWGQMSENISKAIKLGDSLQFYDAIKILKTEIKNNPKNADAFYWLGRYSHYLVYDSRPFEKKGDTWSKNEVIFNLKKAILLNPNLGDAYYFIAVEYSARAREAIERNNIHQAKKELVEARKLGGFPDYILEYGRSILQACEKNAILFSNQDPAPNALMYLQLVEGFRKDISVVCVNLLERPFYIKYLRDGIANEVAKVPISWNENLVMHMYSYFPWKTQNITISMSTNQKRMYNIPDSAKGFNMLVNDKYESGSMWIGTAAILNILENNKFERPVYCALPYEDDMFEFSDYLSNEGFVSKFLPYKVKGLESEYNRVKFEESILNASFYKDFSDIKIHRQPRANYFFVDNRRNLIINFIEFLIASNNKVDAKKVYLKMKALMPEVISPLSKDLEERCKLVESQF